MPGTAVAVGIHLFLFDGKASLGQAIGEGAIGRGGPDRQLSLGPQGTCAGTQPSQRVEPVIVAVRQPFRAIIHIQHDGIEPLSVTLQQPGNILVMHLRARILQGEAGLGPQSAPVPRDHTRHQLGNQHLGIRPQRFQRRRQGKAHAQTTNQHARCCPGSDFSAGYRRQGIFRAMHAAVHQLPALAALQLDHKVLAILEQAQGIRLIRNRGGIEQDMAFHGKATGRDGLAVCRFVADLATAGSGSRQDCCYNDRHCNYRVYRMAAIGRYNSLEVLKHTDFGLYLDGGTDGEILLPRRYIPKDTPTDAGEWLNVFIYLDSSDKLIATTETPRAQVGEFASLKVVDSNPAGIFLDWGLPKDLMLPYSEVKKPLASGDYVVVYLYLDRHTRRITATARLDRHLDLAPATYKVGDAVDLLVVEATDLGFKAIINGQHWGLIHKNEAFKFLRKGKREQGYIRELRPDGKINLSLQPIGEAAADALQAQILQHLDANAGVLALSDKSPPEAISRQFGVSKGNFKKAIGGLMKQGKIRILADRIERV